MGGGGDADAHAGLASSLAEIGHYAEAIDRYWRAVELELTLAYQ